MSQLGGGVVVGGGVSERFAVWIVSDITLVREGLAAQLTPDPRVTIACASCPGDPLPSSDSFTGVFVLDFGSARAKEFVKRARAVLPDARIVGIAIGKSATALADWAEAGVVGFVEDAGSIDDLVRAVLLVSRGEFCCSPRTAAEVIGGLIGRPRAPRAPASRLTPREEQVLHGLERGATNKEIARRLGISSATVKNHVHHLLEKLEVSRRAEAAAIGRGIR